jgi:hypothetical protein
MTSSRSPSGIGEAVVDFFDVGLAALGFGAAGLAGVFLGVRFFVAMAPRVAVRPASSWVEQPVRAYSSDLSRRPPVGPSNACQRTEGVGAVGRLAMGGRVVRAPGVRPRVNQSVATVWRRCLKILNVE